MSTSGVKKPVHDMEVVNHFLTEITRALVYLQLY